MIVVGTPRIRLNRRRRAAGQSRGGSFLEVNLSALTRTPINYVMGSVVVVWWLAWFTEWWYAPTLPFVGALPINLALYDEWLGFVAWIPVTILFHANSVVISYALRRHFEGRARRP